MVDNYDRRLCLLPGMADNNGCRFCKYSISVLWRREADVIGKFALNDLKCGGTEASLEKCSYSITADRINDCMDHEYAGVECNHDSINIDDYS